VKEIVNRLDDNSIGTIPLVEKNMEIILTNKKQIVTSNFVIAAYSRRISRREV